jgi:L-asparaginase II
MDAEVLVRVVRSGFEESVHVGHVAVCDPDGRLVAFAGDPDQPVFARSSMKPLQAAVSLAAIKDETITVREMAVMCASHNGEPVHLDAVHALLTRAALSPDDLRCPLGWPLDHEMARASGEPRRDLHNCSGKHAGMLLACVRQGWDRETYREPEHALQQQVLRAVLAATGLGDVRVGVDGCGVPVHGMPLSRMATLFARLARPERLDPLEIEAQTAVRAMLSEPYLVAGRKRVDTVIMEQAGDVAVKGGAEGLQCAAALGPGWGVAVKIQDGGHRAADPALVRALHLLELLDRGREEIAPFARPHVMGGGKRVGELTAAFELRRP